MNTVKTALFIAYKSIVRGNKSTLMLLIFILSLSFINMMFISGILKGLVNLVPDMVIENISGHITISPQEVPRLKEYIIHQNELRTQLEAIPGVLATTRRYNLAGSLSYDEDEDGESKSLSASIKGIDPEQDPKIMGIAKRVKYGQFLDPLDTDQIVLSSALAGGYGQIAPNDLGGAKVGDKVRVTYSNGIVRTYTIKGIFDDAIGIYENYVTIKTAESVLGVYNNASQILVKVDVNRHPIKHYLDDVRSVTPNLKVQTYEDSLGSFGAFLNALDLIALIVSVISVAVAAVTIFVLIYVNALHKRRQIGLLKAIGIKKNIVVYSYIFQSLFYTVAGTSVGALLVFEGLHPLLKAYPIDVAFGKISLSFTAVGIASAFASFLITGFLAGLIPSHIVAKQKILEAIWG